MDLVLEVRTGREKVTMACQGKLVGGNEAETFRRSAMLLMGGFDHLALNLSGVTAIDCGGLGSLAAVLNFAVERSKRVEITRATPRVREMLALAHLTEFLTPEQPQPVPTRGRAVA